MKTNSTQNQIANYARAGYSGLYLVSHEETRIEAEVKAAADTLEYTLAAWSVTDGITVYNPEGIDRIAETEDPVAMLAVFIGQLHEKTILLARDFHAFLQAPANPMLVRKVKDALAHGRSTNKVLVICGCALHLPPELEKLITVIEFALPTREQIRATLEGVCEAGGVKVQSIDSDAVIDAASGLTTTEAEDAFALSVIEAKAPNPEIVQREKSATIKKNGLLELVESTTTLDDIGGLDNLKADLASKSHLFTRAARDYGLPTPRGLLVVGQPGTGKSLTATATGCIFGLPLIRLEAGKLFGSLVGQSEGNWRAAFTTVKAMAPCVLWIDEVDGLFSGMGSSGSTDGGTTQRVLKAILQDMQLNGEGVFFVFTANDIDNLPDPLIDRLDTWSVELPTHEERQAIWSIHIAKRKRSPKKFDLTKLAQATDGFSGRQIEQVWLKAMTAAFNDGQREPDTTDAIAVCVTTTPTSKLMAEQIERRRKRLANRAMAASKPATVPPAAGRKLAAK